MRHSEFISYLPTPWDLGNGEPTLWDIRGFGSDRAWIQLRCLTSWLNELGKIHLTSHSFYHLIFQLGTTTASSSEGSWEADRGLTSPKVLNTTPVTP